jgi:hypothetical protein
MALTPTERRLRAQIAAETSWARTADPSKRSKPGRDAAFERFEYQADPDHELAPPERRRRAEHLRRAHMMRLALKSAQSRRRKRASP